jgi:hypothetical protein
MQSKKYWFSLIGGCALLLLCLLTGSGTWLYTRFRPQPKVAEQALFQGIFYRRIVEESPRPMVIHILTVELRTEGIQFFVTPGDPGAELPLEARTTTEFLEEFDLQIAVNGDAFQPWHSRTFFDYYPHSGDPVRPLGLAASRGEAYASLRAGAPVLYISRTNQARFNAPIGRVYNAISGDSLLVWQGGNQPAPGGSPEPRSAVALDKAGKRLLIFVVDGRQLNYSEGATLAELAQIIIDNGGYSAMNLDGGGSSTLVRQAGFGRPTLLNRPINHQIPGWQRPVGNHLGIIAQPLDDR